ncbi:hypothetical protein KL936_000344 [Ogataea polymorpha]|nr:hypothetical protein KL936_000344 [Ogataea polymorpha]
MTTSSQASQDVVSFHASPLVTSGHPYFARNFWNSSPMITCIDNSITSNSANRGALRQQASMRHESGDYICPGGHSESEYR